MRRDLVYRRKSLVNWCESCQTVLANEQVEAGLCWRCKSEVAQKELEQWFFRITHYADELLDCLDNAHRLARAGYCHAAQLDRQQLRLGNRFSD